MRMVIATDLFNVGSRSRAQISRPILVIDRIYEKSYIIRRNDSSQRSSTAKNRAGTALPRAGTENLVGENLVGAASRRDIGPGRPSHGPLLAYNYA